MMFAPVVTPPRKPLGSRITYSETIQRVNCVPYWLRLVIRPITRMVINSWDRKQLANLARLADERSRG